MCIRDSHKPASNDVTETTQLYQRSTLRKYIIDRKRLNQHQPCTERVLTAFTLAGHWSRASCSVEFQTELMIRDVSVNKFIMVLNNQSRRLVVNRLD